ncbi:MAG: DUF4097 family beta strand repeat protein [Cyclobacteriaceae bacterium]|nr:DUF4097 family beta strand repeat protein [Cyclobacteriaceae bacterium HetDA_MAG_MS6]
MRYLSALILAMITILCHSQSKYEKSIPVKDQQVLEIDFPYADDIVLKLWEKPEVRVEVEYAINGGEDDEMFELKTSINASGISIFMEKDIWHKNKERWKKSNCWQSEIYYTVYLPKEMQLEANTISGNFELDYAFQDAQFKTISGDIDLTVNAGEGLDFKVKTISGEVYSNLDIQFPEGRDGLRQIVGTNIRGVVNGGGVLMRMETISGNVYLRGE